MAPKSKKPASTGEAKTDTFISATDKIAGLLALIATREMSTDEAALKLDAIGFSAREISALLDVGPNYVNVARHRKKSGSKKVVKKA